MKFPKLSKRTATRIVICCCIITSFTADELKKNVSSSNIEFKTLAERANDMEQIIFSSCLAASRIENYIEVRLHNLQFSLLKILHEERGGTGSTKIRNTFK